MKIEVAISSLSSLLFLFLFLSGPSPASSFLFPPPKPVHDLDGNPLLTGSEYYLVPLLRGPGGGGVTLGQPRSGTFPLDVVQEKHAVLNGLPVSFTMAINGFETGSEVYTSTTVFISFSEAATANINTCGTQATWSVGYNDQETSLRPITTGSKSGFTIVELEAPMSISNGYNLVYCGSTICMGPATGAAVGICTANLVCRNVGVYVDDGGQRRLVAGADTFGFGFKKA